MLELDGSRGEGGGQILRTSLSLSIITGRPFRLRRIRAGRAKPGLQPQHLAGVRAAARISQAVVRGDAIGSQEIVFSPGPVVPGNYRFPIGTAGATGLLLHAVYLPLAFRTTVESQLTLEGGTHVSTSPSFHFLHATWRAYLAKMGLSIGLTMNRPGFYPRGGGTVIATIAPCSALKPLQLTTRPAVTHATGFAAVAGLPIDIAERMIRRVTTKLRDRGIAVKMKVETWENGPGVFLAVEFDAGPPTLFAALGKRGRPSEAVADDLLAEAGAWLDTDAPVDIHSADQILMPLALADGASEFRVTEVTPHLTTNADVIRRFVDRRIEIDAENRVIRVGSRDG